MRQEDLRGRDNYIHTSTARPLPKPGVPRTRSGPERKSTSDNKKGGSHKVRNWALGATAALITTASVGAAAFGPKLLGSDSGQTEGIHQSINRDLYFDNNTVKGVNRPANTVVIPKEDLDKLPDFDEHGNPLLLFPIPIKRNLPFEKELGFPFRATPEYNEAKRVGLMDSLETPNVPPNTPISLTHDGYVFSIVVERAEGNLLLGYTVAFLNPNDGVLNYADTTFTEPIKLNVQAPPLDYDANKNGNEWQKGMSGKKGDLLGFTGNEKSLMSIGINGRKDGSIYNGFIPVPLLFSTQVDSNGLSKLATPPSQ